MKVLIEPNRFQRLLENVLLHHQTSELDANIGKFTATGVTFEDISLDVVVVNIRYSKGYFLEYEVEGTELIPLSKSLLSTMKSCFTADEKIEVYTDDSKIYLKGKTEEYEEPLTDAESEPLPMTFKTHKTMGMLPENLEAKVQVLVKANLLDNLLKAEEVNLNISNEGEITLIAEGVGKLTKAIEPSKTKLTEELQMKFGTKYLTKVVSQFEGEVWLTLRPDAAIFSQKNKDSMLTYLLSSSD